MVSIVSRSLPLFEVLSSSLSVEVAVLNPYDPDREMGSAGWRGLVEVDGVGVLAMRGVDVDAVAIRRGPACFCCSFRACQSWNFSTSLGCSNGFSTLSQKSPCGFVRVATSTKNLLDCPLAVGLWCRFGQGWYVQYWGPLLLESLS